MEALPPNLLGPSAPAAACLDRARACRERGEHDRAVAELAEAIRLDPACTEAFQLRGQVHADREDYDRAIADYTEALQLDFNRALGTVSRMLLASTTQKHFDQADAGQSLRLNHRLAESYCLRAAASCARGDYSRGISDTTQALQLDPANVRAFVQRGEARWRLGDAEGALADFTEALHLDPNASATRARRGAVLQGQGRHAEAIADFTEALKGNPADALTWTRRATSHLDCREFDQAAADCDEAIRRDPGLSRAYLCRSRAHAARGDFEAALVDFVRATALDAGSPPAHGLPGRLQAEHRKAVADLERIRREFLAALDACDRSAESEAPHPADTLSEIGHGWEDRGETDPAPPRGEQPLVAPEPPSAAELAPEQPAPRDAHVRTAGEYHRRGQLLQRRGDHGRAIAEYTAALESDPGHLGAYLDRGQAYRIEGRLDEAIADFTAAIGIDGASAEAHLRRGNAWAGKGSWDLAVADYTTAIRLDPDLAPAYLNRGLAYARMGVFDKVLPDADRALHLEPRLGGALFLRGTTLARRGDYELALADFDLLLELEPKNVLACNERGVVRAALGRFGPAIADYTRALQLDPHCDLALCNRGIASRLKGDDGPAIADLSELIRRVPRSALAHYHRGMAHLARKEHDEAAADLGRAAQLDPRLGKACAGALETIRAREEGPAVSAPPGTDDENQFPEREGQEVGVPPLGGRPQQKLPQGGTPTPSPPSSGSGSEVKPKKKRKKRSGKKGKRRRLAVTPDSPASRPTAVEQEVATKIDVPRTPVSVGSLRLECPECGAPGRVKSGSLGKVLVCKVCCCWMRMDGTGRLIKVEAAGASRAAAERAAGVGSNSPPVPVPSGTDGRTSPATQTPRPTPPPVPPRPSPRRWRRDPVPWSEGRLAAVLGSVPRRWVYGAVLLVLAGLAFGSSFGSSELRTRGEKVARAWLHKDFEEVQKFLEPNHDGALGPWLEKNAPPEVEGQDPTVAIAVERADSKTADVLIQVKATDRDGLPVRYVFRHRWVEKDGTWYFRPLGVLPATTAAAPAAGSPAAKSKGGGPGGGRK